MDQLAAAIINLLQGAPRPVVLYEPLFSGNEGEYVKDCIDTGWVSSVGSYVDRFEADLTAFTGAYAAPVMNGTAALHLALIVAGVEPGDEVLVPDLTFVATANAVHYCHATPHFVEAERESFAVNPDKLDDYLNTLKHKPKFLIVTHIFGHPAPIKKLKHVCDHHGITIIEDAAESLGSWVGEQHTGTFGKTAALSFNGNKILTTGGGGAFLTADKALAERAKHLSTTAKVNTPYMHAHDDIGYNYRMPNLNAALGCAQLELLPQFLEQKSRIADAYRTLTQQYASAKFIDTPADTTSNYWLNNILMPTEDARDALIDRLAAEGIFCRGLWAPMSSLPMYKNCPKMDTSVAQDLCARTISLPSSPALFNHMGLK